MPFERFNDLVIVCCHATYTGTGDSLDEDQWNLQPFQRSDPATDKVSEHHTFIAHILAAAQQCIARPETLLIYSGGPTSTARSEAESYCMVAEALVASGKLPVEMLDCSVTERLATDSYQNLLFSILTFHHYVGHFPKSVTVVTHAFKERRFLELHARAIKWPSSRLKVLGLNPPFTLKELEQTQAGEHERAYKLFAADPYGELPCLSQKRRDRGWSRGRLSEIITDDDAVKRLLHWKGGEDGKELFPEKLPWEED